MTHVHAGTDDAKAFGDFPFGDPMRCLDETTLWAKRSFADASSLSDTQLAQLSMGSFGSQCCPRIDSPSY